MREMVLKLQQKADLEEHKLELEQECSRLEKEVFDLKITAHNAQVDADAMECFSIKGLFLKMVGKHTDRLEETQRKARAAKASYEYAASQLEHVKIRLIQTEQELSLLAGYEDVFSDALRQKLGNNPCTEELLVRSLESAIKAGESLKSVAKDLQRALDTAQLWIGTSPTIIGAAEEMHQAEIQAQSQLNLYMEQLELLCEKLTDLGCSLDIQQTREFGRNYLLGLLTSLWAENRWNNVQQQIVQISRQWNALQPQLENKWRKARIQWIHALCRAGMA